MLHAALFQIGTKIENRNEIDSSYLEIDILQNILPPTKFPKLASKLKLKIKLTRDKYISTKKGLKNRPRAGN